MADYNLTFNSTGPRLTLLIANPRVALGLSGTQGPIGPSAQNLKSLYIISPNSAEDLVLFFTDEALTISKVLIAATGGGSIDWNLILSSTRSAVGTNVFTLDKTTSGAETITTFDDATIDANSYIRFEIVGKTGTVSDVHLTLF